MGLTSTGANLSEAKFRGTKFSGANLSDGRPQWYAPQLDELQRGEPRGANLSEADLSGTNLSVSNL